MTDPRLFVPTPPDKAPPSRFVKRGAYLVCLECDLTAQYCMCEATAFVQDETHAIQLAKTMLGRAAGCAHCGRALAECRCGTTPARNGDR